ncbi:MAG TPA: LamG-like jellyroll fold domain-containing protein, partial [Bacillota bacterium]|nr:LamG-like jellyroll fold domain-containing protein [Bacillota bacterium]
PVFGVYGYGCDVVQSGSNYVITPKDGIFKRLNLISQKLYLELDRDQYTTATVAKTNNYVQLTLKNQYIRAAHTTKLTLNGLVAGTYDILVNETKVGTMTATSGKSTVVSLAIGTASSYTVKITNTASPTVTPTPTSTVMPTLTPSPTPTPTATAGTNPVVWYQFDQSSGTTVTDSINGKNATLVNGPTWVAGKSGNAVNLDGSNDYVNLPQGMVSALGNFTISVWVKLDSISTWARIFDFGSGTNANMFLTPRGSSNGVRFAITTGGYGSEQQINSQAALPTGVWKHVAVTKSGNVAKLYVDGVEVGSNSNMTLSPSNLGSTSANYIGRSQYSDPYLDGQVDSFKIYNRALSAAEITSEFSSAKYKR